MIFSASKHIKEPQSFKKQCLENACYLADFREKPNKYVDVLLFNPPLSHSEKVIFLVPDHDR